MFTKHIPITDKLLQRIVLQKWNRLAYFANYKGEYNDR
jgi:hypothetical protein